LLAIVDLEVSLVMEEPVRDYMITLTPPEPRASEALQP
jgi:hypothetical protein